MRREHHLFEMTASFGMPVMAINAKRGGAYRPELD